MNIDDMRWVVIQGQKATLEAQKLAFQIYSDRTGENVDDIISFIESQSESMNDLI